MAPSEGSGCLHTQEERQTASEAACKQYGVTPPLSKAKPTEADIRRTKELEKFLEEAMIYESTEDASKREVLDCLRQNGSSRIREEGHNQSHGIEQEMLNIHAYLQYGFHTTQQKPAIGINLGKRPPFCEGPLEENLCKHKLLLMEKAVTMMTMLKTIN